MKPLVDAPAPDEQELGEQVATGNAPGIVYSGWAKAAADRGDWTAALDRWRLCRERWPSTAHAAAVGEARALQALGREDEADMVLGQAVADGNRAKAVWAMWLGGAVRRKRWRSAATRAAAAIERWGEDSPPEWRLHLAAALIELERVDEAVAVVEEFARVTGADPQLALRARSPLLSAAIVMVEAVGTKALQQEAIQRLEDVERRHGFVAAVQHVRNVVDACSFRAVPENLLQLLGDRAVGRLRWASALLSELLYRSAGPSPAPPSRFEPRRILLMASYLATNETGPHMRLLNGVAGSLAMSPQVDELLLLLTEETGPEGPRRRDIPIGREWLAYWRDDMAMLAGPAAAKIDIAFVPSDGPVHPQDHAIRLAADFGPDAMVALQGVYGSPVVERVIARTVPTVALQASIGNPEPPHADLVLGHGAREDFHDVPRPEIWRSYRIPLVVFPVRLPAERSALGLTTPLVVASAVGGGRLQQALEAEDAAWARRIAGAVRPDEVGWALIGFTEVEPAQALFAGLLPPGGEEAVSLLSYVEDLRAVLSHCDMFFHPAGLNGGAMGVAMAMEEGKPVIAPRACDAANFLDPSWLYDGLDAGFALLDRCLADHELRRKMATDQLAWFRSRHSLEAVSPDLARFLGEAASNRARRER